MSRILETRASGGARWLWGPSLLVLGLLGCGEDSPTGTPEPAVPVREFWQGTYASRDQNDQGSLVLDIVRSGTVVTGEVVFRSRIAEAPFDHLFVKGTDGEDGLHLALNEEVGSYPFEFEVDATSIPDTGLSGTLSYSPTNLFADIHCRLLPVGSLSVASVIDFPDELLGLAVDGDELWASTLEDFVRLSPAGEILGRVVVFYAQDLRWTSDAFTSDGTHLWGHLPRTVQDQTGLHNRSLIIEFAKDGTITNEFEIPHRTTGLASAGGELWSLPIDSAGFKRFDATGTILESIDVFLPDLSDLEYDGTYFWCTGWFLNRLYQIDKSGEIIRVFDLPQGSGIVVPAAIAYDGSHLWYAEAKLFSPSSRIYKLQVNP